MTGDGPDIEQLVEIECTKLRAEQEDTLSPPDLLTQHQSDYGNSRRFIEHHGKNVRYCHAFRKWLVWDERRLRVDDGERARELAQDTMLEFIKQAATAKNEAALKFASESLNSQRISNALREAQPHLAIRPAELDTHPDLLHCANGTLDLRTGGLRPHRREDLLTKLVHHDYNPNADCQVFTRFLSRITPNHPGLMGYLQRAFGYSLTGHTIEKTVFLLHGRGDNGKTTLLTTFLELLQEYAVLLQIDTLMVRRESNNTQADLADLRGVRFVMTSETEEGQRLAEGELKRITQGMGRIKAVRKYENPIVFPETHKTWMDANHLPIITGTDNAIWNRLHPIPFDTTIRKEDQDSDLPSKLRDEAEGILAWAVAGAKEWYVNGLGKPFDVEEVGQAWRADSDQIGLFIQDNCVLGDCVHARAHALYSAYKQWADDVGVAPLSEKIFGERIVERFRRQKQEAGNVYLGIGLASHR